MFSLWNLECPVVPTEFRLNLSFLYSLFLTNLQPTEQNTDLTILLGSRPALMLTFAAITNQASFLCDLFGWFFVKQWWVRAQSKNLLSVQTFLMLRIRILLKKSRSKQINVTNHDRWRVKFNNLSHPFFSVKFKGYKLVQLKVLACHAIFLVEKYIPPLYNNNLLNLRVLMTVLPASRCSFKFRSDFFIALIRIEYHRVS